MVADDNQMQLLANMLVISSNTAWEELQLQAGNGDDNWGRQAIQNFTQRMGYQRTRGYRGYLGTLHGNELTAAELADYPYDLYNDRFPGAEVVWKLMHTYRTGTDRGERYLPTTVFAGGKTGTYDGATIDPDTGFQHWRERVWFGDFGRYGFG